MEWPNDFLTMPLGEFAVIFLKILLMVALFAGFGYVVSRAIAAERRTLILAKLAQDTERLADEERHKGIPRCICGHWVNEHSEKPEPLADNPWHRSYGGCAQYSCRCQNFYETKQHS